MNVYEYLISFQRLAFPELTLASSLQLLKIGIENCHKKFITLCTAGQLLNCKEKLCFSKVEECFLHMKKVFFFSFWHLRPQSQTPDPY